MKKIFLFVLLPAILYSQIPTNVFPKVGFYDYYIIWKQNHNNYTDDLQKLKDSNYYFHRMKELGLTHLVTFGDAVPLNDTNGLKIIDDNPRYYGANTNLYPFYPYVFCYSTGNEPKLLPFEVGGNSASIESKDDFWGLGNSSKSYFNIVPGSAITNTSYQDSGFIVYVKVKDDTSTSGQFLRAKLRASYQPYGSIPGSGIPLKYYISLVARIDTITGSQDDVVAEINIKELDNSTTPIITENLLHKFSPLNILEDWTDTTFQVKVSDFYKNHYTEIIKGPFRKVGGVSSLFLVTINWNNKRTLLLDKMSVSDNYYRKLFLSGTDSTNYYKGLVNDQLNSFSSPASSNNYTHLYVDEPDILMNRGLEIVSEISSQKFNKYVNGAYLSHIQSDFETANYLRRPPYVSMDQYPFDHGVDSSTSAVQTALDNLIDLNRWSELNSNSGLRHAIKFAQNFNNDASSTYGDDIPYYQIIQAHASIDRYVKSGDTIRNGSRLPTKQEILVQGNLALCYGAKGIMYWLLGTETHQKRVGNWGLFDEQNNPFDGKNYWQEQNLENPVVPNDRFYAVKELNLSIDKISSELLSLTWVNGFSINHPARDPLGSNYISEITTSYSNNLPNSPVHLDPDTTTYVELGEFKKTSDSNPNLEYFFLVNKRCDPLDTRCINVQLNKPGSSYVNWGIRNIGSNKSWTITNTGDFTDTLAPGTGKLYRLAPVAYQGGRIDLSEEITGTNTLSDSMTIGLGATLTITGTYYANANIIIEPGGNLIVAPGGHLNFANGCSVIYSCPHLTLTAIIEGLYNGSTMVPDTVTVELLNSSSPYSLVDSYKGVLDSTGCGSFFFTSASNNTPYYIAIKHRNAIETWSASALTFTSNTLSYDFTTDTTQAYGSNMTQIEPKWCFYSGDVNQDGYINLLDYNLVNNDAYNHVTGYVVTDLTGNLYINLSDLMIVNNNRYNLVHARSPLFNPETSITKPIVRINQQLKNDK